MAAKIKVKRITIISIDSNHPVRLHIKTADNVKKMRIDDKEGVIEMPVDEGFHLISR